MKETIMLRRVIKLVIVPAFTLSVFVALGAYSGATEIGISKDEMSALEKGREIFHSRCAVCHGFDGVPELPEAPDFSKGERLEKSDAELIEAIKHGKDIMPAWKDELSEDEIGQVLAYSRIILGDSIFQRNCLNCHNSFVPAVSGKIPTGQELLNAGPLDFCSACNVEMEMEPEEVKGVIDFIRTFQYKGKKDHGKDHKEGHGEEDNDK